MTDFEKAKKIASTRPVGSDEYNVSICSALEMPVWKKSEPEIGQQYLLMFHDGWCVNTCEYHPSIKKFYYYEGDYCLDVPYNSDELIGWMYVSELENLPKEND